MSEDEQDRPLGFPGARLKHTQTIMGGRTGGLGLRVNAKVASTSRRMSRNLDVKNFVFNAAPVQEAAAKTLVQSAPDGNSWIKLKDSDGGESPEPTVQVHQATAPEVEDAPVTKAVQFIPKFKGAAEMEARRRVRMAARRGPAPLPVPQPNLHFSSSSSDEGTPNSAPAVDGMDEGDEFDP